MRIIFATGNMGKMNEIREIMADFDVEVLSMKEAGVQVEVEETGTTFLENSFLKARGIAALCKEKGYEDIVLADDSGLEIDYLNKEPGIYSARYMGEDTPYSVKNGNLLERMAGVPDEKRTARFVCAVAGVLPDGREVSAVETIEGLVAYEEKGEHGFGYDPIFFLPEYGCTSAEILPEEKNRISHRGKALAKMKEILAGEFGV